MPRSHRRRCEWLPNRCKCHSIRHPAGGRLLRMPTLGIDGEHDGRLSTATLAQIAGDGPTDKTAGRPRDLILTRPRGESR